MAQYKQKKSPAGFSVRSFRAGHDERFTDAGRAYARPASQLMVTAITKSTTAATTKYIPFWHNPLNKTVIFYGCGTVVPSGNL